MARHLIEEAFLYVIVAAFFGLVAAGSVAHRHGGSCGHATHSAQVP